METPVRLPFEYKYLKKIHEFERKDFPICTIKEKESGVLEKKLLYIHFDGKLWNILIVFLKTMEIKHFAIPV